MNRVHAVRSMSFPSGRKLAGIVILVFTYYVSWLDRPLVPARAGVDIRWLQGLARQRNDGAALCAAQRCGVPILRCRPAWWRVQLNATHRAWTAGGQQQLVDTIMALFVPQWSPEVVGDVIIAPKFASFSTGWSWPPLW